MQLKYTVKKMTEQNAIDVLTWKYEKPYDFYNNVLSGDAILELQDGSYKTIHNQNNDVIGFFCIGKSAQVPNNRQEEIYPEDYIDIGLGMKPELTGKGKGFTFLSTILNDIQKDNPNKKLRLTVANFNKRAIRLYEKFDFIPAHEFTNERATFITMEREA